MNPLVKIIGHHAAPVPPGFAPWPDMVRTWVLVPALGVWMLVACEPIGPEHPEQKQRAA